MSAAKETHGGISAPFIRHPVATAMLMIALLLVGVICYRALPIASLPAINQPTIQVTADMPGADPQTMASSVATPLERQLGRNSGAVADDVVECDGFHGNHAAVQRVPDDCGRCRRCSGGD